MTPTPRPSVYIDDFDVSEDAEEVVRYLESAKLQLEQEFAIQLSNAQSKEAYDELLKAQSVDDIIRAMSSIDQIADYLGWRWCVRRRARRSPTRLSRRRHQLEPR